jgi:hypothetical protein
MSYIGTDLPVLIINKSPGWCLETCGMRAAQGLKLCNYCFVVETVIYRLILWL